MFSQLFDLANRIATTCQNPKEELSKHGITADTIRRAKSALNFPGIGWLINKYGNKEQLLADLNKLEQIFEPNYPLAEQAPASELEQLQANLARLK